MEKSGLHRLSKRTVLLLLIVMLIVLGAVAVFFGRPLIELFSDRSHLEQVIRDAGPLGPLVLITLQALQVLVAPIPGQITSFVSGYLFGTVEGAIYSMIGVTIGFSLVMFLARRRGRPFVEYFVNKKTLDKFDYLAESNGVFIFFLMALLPFFPDDLICYIAGLTKIRLRTLILVTFLGRLPGNIIFAFAGQGVADSKLDVVFYMTGVSLVISVLVWWKRKQLEQLIKKWSKKT